MNDIPVIVSVSQKAIAGLLCDAFEGGVNYWCETIKYHAPDTLNVTYDKLSGNDDPKVYPHIDYLLPGNLGGYIAIRDIETGQKYKLTPKHIVDGLAVMAEKFPAHFANVLSENDDAETGDVLIQCAVFGDVIYG